VTDSSPALSIVITGRNDDYGVDFTERFLTALQFNSERLSEAGVACEVVLVEWNPVPGRPLLCDIASTRVALRSGGALTRIVVPPEYHVALTQNPRLGYLEYVAKNVGIRRAAAPWILVTNTDVLLGRHVVGAIAGGRLSPGTIHRAARFDIMMGPDQSHLTWDALEHPANHVRTPVLAPPLFSGGSGDFMLTDRQTLLGLGGYNEVYRAARSGIDLNFLVKAHGCGYPIADVGGPVYHINHTGSFRLSKAAHRHNPSDTPWGDLRWHSRQVTYNNPNGWGLAEAPARRLGDGTIVLDFDWRAVPPLVDLRRIVLPVVRVEVSAAVVSTRSFLGDGRGGSSDPPGPV
jgi:hypothetical protein